MRTFDFSPFARNAIGFETLFDRLNDRHQDNNEGYPPYDIIRKGEDQFQINLAIAGFSPNEITITAEAACSRSQARNRTRATSNTCTRVSPRAPSSAASISPTTSRSRTPRSRTGCSISTWCGAFRTR